MKTSEKHVSRVAIIGGGVAGATAAVHLGELGIEVFLLERGDGLVNGPPICHLHAGGNLYREISESQCLQLLRQSVETVRLYPHTLNKRPTIIATPVEDPHEPGLLLSRLKVIKQAYQQLVDEDPRNQVLGDPGMYYQLYSREELERLKHSAQPELPQSFDDWVIPFARHTDLDRLKYPVVAVQEYGWSVFRLAASATLTLSRLPGCHLMTRSTLVDSVFKDNQWRLKYIDGQGQLSDLNVDYMINACGYQTGKIDDLTRHHCERMVEFKAAYVTRWAETQFVWPEVIFHGQRGTPLGMAQLTPYADGVFQLHGMTTDITLFKDGLVKSSSDSSQPDLPGYLQMKLDKGWEPEMTELRTKRAIEHVGQFIPDYYQAEVLGKPLYGAQQIPGQDASLRAADVSFSSQHYARMEIVKGSSALEAARKIVDRWQLVPDSTPEVFSVEEQHPVCTSLHADEVEKLAVEMAEARNYPVGLAKVAGV
ncbi:tRNA 5-methylaminomethyl-2-thiouridine biosynthesis bifunctional protein MnmC [Vibrio aerogenes CECT 7868]|uniref:tRNA 5-methylaminomethyl-2-thiouridine biosynthesis bifunctional protein MnmC n=1 Tax=Vibrio aerogenes CECT 7868 TaxID=1216006 RepID=A0A1M5ZVH1_9VIBR|nr:FAD-dependent oxidoreductase [Vibrio aerogenes]SHI28156.1 tRNA 5-methylaminomethyl-2-thiouridine biosynthesis bifunctional protein MnmC [Vibrio aerogenes CECT 7868]